MKKIHFFKFDTTRYDLFLPGSYFSFKRYYELNGRHPDQWQWIAPKIDYTGWSIEDIVEDTVQHQADVYAFSSYMWSWNVIKIVSQKVKKLQPNALLVLGGPHQNTTHTSPLLWFKKYPWFDATCTPTEYGEWFLTDTLDSIIDNNLDWCNVRNSYHPGGRGPQPNKRDFVFPSGVYSTNLDESMKYAEYSQQSGRPVTVLYETNRGCPYGCVYCEWGGGINTKVVPNSMENIADDLSYFPVIGVKSVYITDANFGILPRDAKIAEMFAALKDQLNDVYIGGLAKVQIDKRRAVLTPLIESGLVRNYQMSIQTVSPIALKNIDRTDISLEDNIAMARSYIDDYDIGVNVELILGLPGSTLDDFYEECNIVHRVFNKYSGVTRAPFFVMPDTPAANPDYIKQHQLQLVPLGMEGEGGEQVQLLDQEYIAIYDNTTVSDQVVFIPVSSSSYTVDDWKQMMFMTDFDMIISNQHLLTPMIEYLRLHQNFSAGQTLRRLYEVAVAVPGFYQPFDRYLDLMASGQYADKDWRKVELDGVEEPIFNVLLKLWSRHRSEIFQKIRQMFADFMHIDEFADLVDYLEMSTFRETQAVKFSVKYAWDAWEESRQHSVLPEFQIRRFHTLAKPIDWTTVDVKFIRTCHTIKEDGTQIEVVNSAH